MSKFWNFIKNAATETEPESIELRIDGDIIPDDDSWFYEIFGVQATAPNSFKTELAQYAGKAITVWIDSYGGDCFAATGIYNALKEHSKNGGAVNVKIDGKAMSAASMIAMAGDKVEMSPAAVMMIHDPLTYAEGYASDLRKAADILDTVKSAIVNAYQLKTGRSRAKISQMMDDETYMDANEAIKNGFADGMLYTDKSNTDNVVNFAFNRHLVLNCAKSAMSRFFAFDQKVEPVNGVDPGNISTETSPEDTAWQKPTLADFTDKSWDKLTDQEKKDIAKHYAWASEMPPSTFGDLKFPHHDPKSHKVVWHGISNCAERLDQADIPEEDKQKVKDHLGTHYKAFDKTPPWEQENKAKAICNKADSGECLCEECSNQDCERSNNHQKDAADNAAAARARLALELEL